MSQENIKHILVVVIALVVAVGGYYVMQEDLSGVGLEATSSDSTLAEGESSGQQMGYIKSFHQEDGKYYLVIDYAVKLNGEEAIQARLEDGDCSILEGDCGVPNFYIQNNDPELRTFELASDVKVIIATWSFETNGDLIDGGVVLDLATFVGLFDGTTETTPDGAPAGHFKDSPYWITLENGVVVEIEEQYLP